MNSSLRRAFLALRKARLIGYASACFCMLTTLLVLDGLQALMRDDFNRIDLPLGGQTRISGAMPLQAKDYTDITATVEGNDGLKFMPLASFKGFWLGAPMWRATLAADAATTPGRAVLTVLDLVPAKSATSNATIMVQNPNLIYIVTVWPSEEAMLAAHFSLSRRLTGLSAFLLAGLSISCGIALGAWHLFLYQTAQQALAREGLFAIHGMLKTDAGYQAIFSPGARTDLREQQPVFLLTPEGLEQRRGVLSACSPHKHSALFSLDGVPPRYGWLLRYEPDIRESEHEKSIPAPEQQFCGLPTI